VADLNCTPTPEAVALYLSEKQGQPTIYPHSDGGYVWSWCPECGPDVKLDEDGCCVGCGLDATHYGVEPTRRDA